VSGCAYVDGTSLAPERARVSHKEFPVFGVRFHRESIGTAGGARILRNSLDGAG